MHKQWICCQIGAREHYSVARGLQSCGCLDHLITDIWSGPGSLSRALPKRFARLRQRFHPEISTNKVYSFNTGALAHEFGSRLSRGAVWDRIIARNHWFQDRARRQLGRIHTEFVNQPFDRAPVLFAYSYAARELFEFAKQRGWRTVLGQIDPGPVEERLVADEHARHSLIPAAWSSAPENYWAEWRQECDLADYIVVNSEWSRTALEQEGIDAHRIRVIPLAYNAPQAAKDCERIYPKKFTHQRPLRVLFLGQIILRKGLAALLSAAKLLEDQPVEFHMVGAMGIRLPDSDLARPNIKWFGSVPRARVHDFYKNCDVFLFPTLSDGFGLTQLEAQAWSLPLIASRNCGDVVQHGVNGFLLDEVSGSAIASLIDQCLADPQGLATLAHNSQVDERFSLQSVARKFRELEEGNTLCV